VPHDQNAIVADPGGHDAKQAGAEPSGVITAMQR